MSLIAAWRSPALWPVRRPRFARPIAALELSVSVPAVVAGVLMLIRPDGSLLAANPQVLTTTPFQDWTVPGALLAVLIGGGFLVACAAEWSGATVASVLSAAAGSGLIAFEVVQLGLIGWHPLQPVMMMVGLALLLLVNMHVSYRASAGRTMASGQGE